MAWLWVWACAPSGSRTGVRASPLPDPAAAHHDRLVSAARTPGVWTGPAGTIEVTGAGRWRLRGRVCQYPDLDPTHADGAHPVGCQDVDAELPLVGVEGPFVVLAASGPQMPLYAPAWLDGAGTLHLGPIQSNRVWAATVDAAGHAEYPFTPAHTLVVDPGPACRWRDGLAKVDTAVPCAAAPDGAVRRLSFTVPPGGFGPWAGEHGVVWSPEDGVLVDPEVEVVTYTRQPR